MIPMQEAFDYIPPPQEVVIYRLRTIGLEPKILDEQWCGGLALGARAEVLLTTLLLRRHVL